MAVMLNQDQFGVLINDLADRLSKIEWYKNAGKSHEQAEVLLRDFMKKLHVTDYVVKWISKAEAAETISKLRFEESPLWEVLSALPDQFKKKVDERGQGQLLEKAVDALPEFVFHVAFKRAFSVFQEEKTVRFLTGHAMYIAVLIAAAEIAGQSELFSPLMELLEHGHVPLGLEGNVIYLL
ncbi:hypothetical protein JOC94_001263 [Bacillus thermophilus]|uniref:Uncharacterized protein n=1 Tax=Siminovitchia thermophila TaxID=1245522 RepID=A0ABS2R3U2_9BACI|nr:hypothetical protein [Siminovitchia thermophila]MBM7714291.1 hypothetical protein [Siminovitchia thermophila]ONK22193.1 hypothetical protein BLX87_17355 [Bacillus sp. VT-16-64]